jgi:membrane protein implicated in regulation of membrane protease activity
MMPWWGWIVVGVLLLGAEILVPTDFWLVFIGLAAIAVGLVATLAPGLSDAWQWALFGGLAAVSVLFFRRLVRKRFPSRPGDSRVDDTLVGDAGRALETLAPGAIGRVELRGSVWNARNAGEGPIEPDARVRVERVEGLTLHVRRES